MPTDDDTTKKQGEQNPPNPDKAKLNFAKLLPADLTAAFLSVKAGSETTFGTVEAAGIVFWSFVAITIISPWYFRYVTKVQTQTQSIFLSATFVVFAISVAYSAFANYLNSFSFMPSTTFTLKAFAVVVPMLWVFLVAPIITEKEK